MIYNNVTLVYDFDENLEILRSKAIEIFEPNEGSETFWYTGF